MPLITNKRSPDYWRAIRPGQSITLRDLWSLQKGQEKGAGVRGLEYTVERIQRIDESRNLATWIMMDLRAPDEIMWLLVKIVDQNIAVRLMDESEAPEGNEFPAGDRADQIKWQNFFLFQRPDDPDHIDLLKLRYSENISIGGVDYHWRGQEFNGRVSISPLPSGFDHVQMATLVEYGVANAETKAEFPNLLILEVGKAKNPNGGLIHLYKGKDISPTEVDVL